jgi:hypothetical protein
VRSGWQAEAPAPPTRDAGDSAFYAKAHQVYQAMYPALKPICAEIAGL